MGLDTKKYILGIDYGTDSCRVLLVDSADGQELAPAVSRYPRWSEGYYCDAIRSETATASIGKRRPGPFKK